jgi:hypothetical protein
MSGYRVVQWATGNTGQRALREVVRHPGLDLVGVLVYDEAKDGVDAGKPCGEEPTGIVATTDRDAIVALAADATRASSPRRCRSRCCPCSATWSSWRSRSSGTSPGAPHRT